MPRDIQFLSFNPNIEYEQIDLKHKRKIFVEINRDPDIVPIQIAAFVVKLLLMQKAF